VLEHDAGQPSQEDRAVAPHEGGKNIIALKNNPEHQQQRTARPARTVSHRRQERPARLAPAAGRAGKTRGRAGPQGGGAVQAEEGPGAAAGAVQGVPAVEQRDAQGNREPAHPERVDEDKPQSSGVREVQPEELAKGQSAPETAGGERVPIRARGQLRHPGGAGGAEEQVRLVPAAAQSPETRKPVVQHQTNQNEQLSQLLPGPAGRAIDQIREDQEGVGGE
jgi:hypothetical protein